MPTNAQKFAEIGADCLNEKGFNYSKMKQLRLYCICLVRMKWAPTRQWPFVKTKEYVWPQNKDYMGGATC